MRLEVQISANTGRSYRVQRKEDGNGLTLGSLVYSDREYRYATVAASVQGATYIATPNDDKGENGLQLTINVNKPVQLYVALSDRVEVRPSWFNSFQDTGEDVSFLSPTGNVVNLSLYQAAFPAGPIRLGLSDPTGIGYTMYTIVIKD